jgi:flavorubredoxin
MAVKGGDKLDLGGGHEMEFVMAPNLHWWAVVGAGGGGGSC